jgi:predicted Zn-ribbon and HTH transcriptional regulator
MGQIIEARCTCGFTSGRIFAGGGFMNFEEARNAPAVCTACGILFAGNYFSKDIRCPKCKKKALFYDDPALRVEAEGEDTVFSWGLPDGRTFTLPEIDYYCPQCKQKKMRFYTVGFWD